MQSVGNDLPGFKWRIVPGEPSLPLTIAGAITAFGSGTYTVTAGGTYTLTCTVDGDDVNVPAWTGEQTEEIQHLRWYLRRNGVYKMGGPFLNVQPAAYLSGQTITIQAPDPDTTVTVEAQGGGGVTVHGNLTGRDATDQHPQSAITGLTAALTGKEATGVAAGLVATEAALARNADNLTSGTVADARLPAGLARDSEVTAAIAALGEGGWGPVDMVEVPPDVKTEVVVSGGRITRHVYVTQPLVNEDDRSPFLELPPAADHEGESIVLVASDSAASATVAEVINTPAAGFLTFPAFWDWVSTGGFIPGGDFTVTWDLDGTPVVVEVEVGSLGGLEDLRDAIFGPLVTAGATLDMQTYTVTSGTTGDDSVVALTSQDTGTDWASRMTSTAGSDAGTIRGVDSWSGVLGASLWYPDHQVVSATGTHNHTDLADAIQRGLRLWAMPASLNNGTAKWTAEHWPVRSEMIAYRSNLGLPKVRDALDAIHNLGDTPGTYGLGVTVTEDGGDVGLTYTRIDLAAQIADAISDVVDGAPGALDTLNELAAALGDDANYAATITTALSALDSRLDTLEAGSATDAWEIVTDQTLPSDTASVSVNVTGYSQLRYRVVGRSTNTGSATVGLRMTINSDTGSNYSTAGAAAAAFVALGNISGSQTNTNRVSAVDGDLAHVTGAWAVGSMVAASQSSITTVSAASAGRFPFLWMSTAVLTSVQFFPASGSLAAGSRVIVEGRA